VEVTMTKWWSMVAHWLLHHHVGPSVVLHLHRQLVVQVGLVGQANYDSHHLDQQHALQPDLLPQLQVDHYATQGSHQDHAGLPQVRDAHSHSMA
jgi:hypothetical protein